MRIFYSYLKGVQRHQSFRAAAIPASPSDHRLNSAAGGKKKRTGFERRQPPPPFRASVREVSSLHIKIHCRNSSYLRHPGQQGAERPFSTRSCCILLPCTSSFLSSPSGRPGFGSIAPAKSRSESNSRAERDDLPSRHRWCSRVDIASPSWQPARMNVKTKWPVESEACQF